MKSLLKFASNQFGIIICLLIRNSYIFRIFNYIYEQSPYRIVRLLVKFVKLPEKDNYWTIWLINGKKIRTKIYANNIKTAQFAYSYKWHNPALNFTEKLLISYYPIEVPWIDIGANLGLRSLLAITENKPVYFIEPNSELNKLNIERCELNGFYNYKSLEIGVSDKSGMTEFTIDKSSYKSSIVSGLISEEEIDHLETIRIDTLDNVFRDIIENKKNAIIKIDVEGHEFHVLKGATRLISALSPTMIIEVNKKDNHFFQFVDFFKDLDYEIFEIGIFAKRVYFRNIKKGQDIYPQTIKHNDFLIIKEKQLISIIRKYTLE